MIDQFAAELVKRIRKDMNEHADHLASNRAQTMEDYRYLCGILRGLAIAEQYINDLAKLVEESDDG